jgi:hypothetical protein
MNFTFKTIFSIILLFLISGCSSDPGPSKSDLRQSVSVQTPSYLVVEDFEVKASQNTGTKTDPVYESRFSASLRQIADTYYSSRIEPNALIIAAQKKKNDSVQVFGKTTSILNAGKWKTIVSFDGDPLNSIGKPIIMFSAPRVIIQGSKEEQQYRMELQRSAEEAKKAQEQREQMRIQSFQQASQILVGKWRDENSMVSYKKDGVYFLKGDNGVQRSGRWSIDGDLLSNKMDDENHDSYIILEISPYQYRLKSIKTGSVWNAKRIE